MSFLKRHQQIIEKVGPVSPLRLWLNTVVFSAFIFAACLGYLYWRSKSLSTFSVNQAGANTGVILIGLSFLLSSICYFFNFADTKIIYRKHLGIIGFAFGLAHVLLVVVFMPGIFPFSDWFGSEWLVALLGLIAVLLFSFMTVISTRYVVTVMGGKLWRTSLRYAGYAALIFVWFHSIIATSPRWIGWLTQPSGLPPLGLIVAVYSVVVVLARLVLAVSLWRTAANTSA